MGNTASGKLSRGGDGDDIIQGGPGADFLFGGFGNNTLSYAASSSGVLVSLNATLGTFGDAMGDQIFNFENLIGSAKGDSLFGTTGVNVIDGGAGLSTSNAG